MQPQGEADLFFFVIFSLVTGGYTFTVKEVSGNYASQVFSVLMMKTAHVRALYGVFGKFNFN